MIRHLAARLRDSGLSNEQASLLILTANPLHILLHMGEVWEASLPPTNPARASVFAATTIVDEGPFSAAAPEPGSNAWDHLAYSYVIENTRVIQILQRIVDEFRSGERLGHPSEETLLWLEATEALLFNSLTPGWPFQTARSDPEAVRRNAYWRYLGLDLAFGSPDDRPPTYERAEAANRNFTEFFEQLLRAVADAFHSLQAPASTLLAIDDRIFHCCEALQVVLNARRANGLLIREELVAATVLGWAELTLSFNSPVVIDLDAEAYRPAERLRLMGERVGIPAHSKSASFLALAPELPLLLRHVEAGIVRGPDFAWTLYRESTPQGSQLDGLGQHSRIVVEEWAEASGRVI